MRRADHPLHFITTATVLVLFLVMASLTPLYAAANDPIAPFYGHYVGKATDGAADVTAMRNAEVIIKPLPRGFNLQWTTTIFRGDKPVIRKFSINFTARDKGQVYSSAMKINTFGHRVALDPLKGDPFVWAVVAGETMTVHSLLIFQNGGYEMQSYERRRTQLGLDLRFTRIRTGVIEKVVQGKLKRK